MSSCSEDGTTMTHESWVRTLFVYLDVMFLGVGGRAVRTV